MRTKPREFNWGSGENPFDWIVTEVERIRYWDASRHDPQPASKPTLKSLKGFDSRNALLTGQGQKSGFDTPGEHTFEVSQARKL